MRQMGVRRIDDPHHPRGYREIRSNAEMRKLRDRKIVAQNSECAICNEKFTDYTDIVPDHIYPRGMGGAWRDDHSDNIQAVHWWGKREKSIEQRVTPGRRAIGADTAFEIYEFWSPLRNERSRGFLGVDEGLQQVRAIPL